MRLLWKIGCILVVIPILVSLSPAQVNAQSTGDIIFQDNFEDGLHKWQPTRDDGSLWQVVNGKAEAFVEQHSTITELIPKDEFWNPAWRNLEYELDFSPIEGVDRNISFGFQDLGNWYEIHFVTDIYNVVHYRNGSPTLDIFVPYVLLNGQTYHVKVRHNLAHIQVWVDGVKIADAQDWAFDPQATGRVGLKVGTGAIAPSRVQFDNVQVRFLEPEPGKQLEVPLLKQSDPAWADDEYDTAGSWAGSEKSTIRRWGCALTAITMIMRHYGMATLPDSQPLTPKTVNAWLQQQSDGYLGQGSVNWVALTRLTRLIHDRLNTPKLEYRRFAEGTSFAKREIEADRPVILEIPGHFLVGDGITGDYQDILIKDPAYHFRQLSEHHAQLKSVRQFVPSNTDLSYIVLAVSANVQVTLSDPQGYSMSSSSRTQPSEVIQDPESGTTSPPMNFIYFPKPTEGRFVVRLRRLGTGPVSITGFSYTVDATPTQLNLPSEVGDEETMFFLEYQKTTAPTLYRPRGFQDFRNTLEMLQLQEQWRDAPGFERAMTLAEFAEFSAPPRQRRYLIALEQIVQQETPLVSATARDQLMAELNDVRLTLHLE